jgi:hypothetical protein
LSSKTKLLLFSILLGDVTLLERRKIQYKVSSGVAFPFGITLLAKKEGIAGEVFTLQGFK